MGSHTPTTHIPPSGDDEPLSGPLPTVNSFAAVAKLLVPNAYGGVDHGTGWLVGPSTVITAAHCIYDRERRRARHVEVRLREQRTHAVKFNIPSAWTETPNPSPRYDYGAISLAAPLIAPHEILLPAAYLSTRLHGQHALVLGFGTGQKLHWRPQTIDSAPGSPGRLKYGLEMETGDSGAPVIIQTHSGPKAVGIHIGETYANGTCVHITRKVLANILLWVSHDSYR
ncbi:MAG: hypothetical protein SangKO_050030 [Sandaracinaceae bacterium]